MASEAAKFLPPPLRIEHLNSDTDAVLIENLKFYSPSLKRIVVAPAGFITDFASIPRIFWRVFPKRGKHDPAAVIHDAAYRGRLTDRWGVPFMVTKEIADRLFDEALGACGVSGFRRRAFVCAVRWFGRPKKEIVT